MSEQAVSDVALTARILGAAFYYPPSEIVQITELLSSGEWVAEWPYGDDAQKQAAAQKLGLAVTGEETLAQAYQRLFIGPHHRGVLSGWIKNRCCSGIPLLPCVSGCVRIR